MPEIITIFSPLIADLYSENFPKSDVVIIDILRATTTMITAFQNGCNKIIPVLNTEDAKQYKNKANYLIAAERNAIKVEGFDLGNSPQEYTFERVNGKSIVLTTTNGTRAIAASKFARNVFIGAFINLHALVERLSENNNTVFLFCSGWKDKFNLEDTIFAGAICELLVEKNYTIKDDSSHAALDLWRIAKTNLHQYLQKANHVERFNNLHNESDLELCLQINTSKLVPYLKQHKIVVNHAE